MTPSLEVTRQDRAERRCRAVRVVHHLLLSGLIALVVGTLSIEIITQINHVRVTWPGEMQ